jgi:anti-sigma B factor antagonist
MDINVRTVSGTTVVDLSGELTWKSAPEAEQRILAEVQPEAKICLDMSRVTYMASAGLRLLLKVYRTVSSQGGRVLLVGVSEDIRDTIEVTGFLTFFTLCDNLESGIADLTS